MKLGLNLSFAVKRWMEPEMLADMCSRDFDVKHIQFSWDLIDPWWPEALRDPIIDEYRLAFEKNGLSIDATFGGLASYSYGQLLAPSQYQREIAMMFFKRAIDLTVRMGAKVMGTPVGGMSYLQARDGNMRAQRYGDMTAALRELAAYGREKGLEAIHIEATPLWTEFPHNPEACLKLMQDLEGTAIPIRLLVDWGHALFKPLLGEEADIMRWFKTLAPYIGSIHLQQTDGIWDRHWDFTHEGIVTPELILKATQEAGLDSVVQYLEVVTIFEEDDDAVYDRMKQSMTYLHKTLGA